MSDEPVRDLAKPSPGDLLHQVARVGLSALGPAGGAAAELLGVVIMPPVQRRILAFLDNLQARVKRLEEEGRVRLEDLSENPAFVDATVAALRAAATTSEREKLDALRNAVLNASLPGTPDPPFQQLFLRFVDEFGVWHLRALGMLHDPHAWLSRSGEDPSGLSFEDPAAVLLHVFPGVREEWDFWGVIQGDLERAGLVAFRKQATPPAQPALPARVLRPPKNPLGNRLVVTPGTRWTTQLGDQFLRFITDPA